MDTGLYVALSSQIALERRLTTLADNMANSNTVGFRGTDVRFESLVSGGGRDKIDFVSSGDTYIPDVGGPLSETGNPFDFAVMGDAWFAIETPAGTVMTRDGRFSMTDVGELVTLQGYPVLDAGGAPIRLDPNAGPPAAGQDGSLRQGGRLIGAIGLFQFQPGVNFKRFGNSGIVPEGRPEPAVDMQAVGVTQGFIEQSNVNPVQEMMRLIQVQRAFEQISALVREGESAIQEAMRDLGTS